MKELSKKIVTEEYLNGELVSRVIEEVYSDEKKSFSDVNGRPTITFEEAPGCKYDSSKEYLINGRRTLLL